MISHTIIDFPRPVRQGISGVTFGDPSFCINHPALSKRAFMLVLGVSAHHHHWVYHLSTHHQTTTNLEGRESKNIAGVQRSAIFILFYYYSLPNCQRSPQPSKMTIRTCFWGLQPISAHQHHHRSPTAHHHRKIRGTRMHWYRKLRRLFFLFSPMAMGCNTMRHVPLCCFDVRNMVPPRHFCINRHHITCLKILRRVFLSLTKPCYVFT